MAYSEVTDLLIGDTRLDGVIDPQAFVDAAADEIDAAIGYLYITPIDVPDDAVNRPTLLLLKTINNYLATGRILLTISRSGEDNSLDALGKYYVSLAVAQINNIVSEKIELVGATRQPSDPGPTFKGPTIVNAEDESFVDRFYGGMNPSNASYWDAIVYGRPNYRPGVTP